jgi:VIT1/CCC1 family predicted Fe2+/Mn2+ transporter
MSSRALTIGPDSRRVALIERASVREVLMGAQDNLTNVMAVVLGVGLGSGEAGLAALAGVAAAVAEAISMAGVLYTSTLAERELDERDGGSVHMRPGIGPIGAGLVTGTAALVGGLVPLAPFAVLPLPAALVASLAVSLAALFGLGAVTATLTRRSAWRGGMRLVLIASAAAVAAASIGVVLRV